MAEEKRKKSTSSTSSKGTSAKKKSAPSAEDQGRRKTITAVESIGFLVLIAVGLVLANVASTFLYGRMDLTENKVHSLSQGSERLVGGLEDTMEVTAYFTEDLPEPFNATEQYVRHLLSEYQASSGGKLRVRFVNPDTDRERERAEQDGVREVPHQVIGNDSVNVRNGYRGLVIRYLGERETIPVISETRGLEYAITQAIRRLVREPQPVGIASGHGSPSLTKGLGSLRGALPQYELREVNVGEEIDADEVKALLIISPTERFTDTELRRINQYVMNGGSLGIFGGAMNLDISGFAPTARAADTGVNELLRAWGMRMEPSIVADARCGRVPMRTPIGIPIPVAYPPALIVVFDEEQQEHPATFRLPQAPFFFSSPIETTDVFGRLHGKVLGRSSEEMSWLLTGDSIELQPRDPREWQTSSTGPHNVMVSVQGRLPSAFAGASGGEGANIEAPDRSRRPVQVLVAGTGSLLRDEFMPPPEQQQQGQMTGGLALALNAVDWLTQDQDLIAIRAKNIEDPAIDVPQSVRRAQEDAQETAQRIQSGQIENEEQAEEAEREVETAVRRYNEAIEEWDSKKFWYRVFAVVVIPLIIILAGLVRWLLRRSKRAGLDEMRARLIQQRRVGPSVKKRT